MNKIIWNDAPDDATHYNTKNDLFYRFNSRGDCEYWAYFAWVETSTTLQDYAGHWVEKPFAWTGDGLPPVGTVCEIKGHVHHELRGQPKDWVECVILAHTDFGGSTIAVAKTVDNSIGWGTPSVFRIIRTPEQIAEEERKAAQKAAEKDIAALLESWGLNPIDSRQAARAIHSAGYRKAGDA